MAKSLAIAYSMKKKKKAAKKEYKEKDRSERDVGVHSGYPKDDKKGKSVAGEIYRGAGKSGGGKDKHQTMNELAKTLHEGVLDDLRSDKKDRKNLAEGGEVTCPHCTKSFAYGGFTEGPHDVGGSPRYSEGGQIANDTRPKAGSLVNEFDDLVLRDDEEIGEAEEDEDDLISSALAKRKKK